MRVLFFLLAVFVAFSVAADLDGDGYDSDASFGEFQDCCDTVDDGCYDPYLVNPGAWEIPDNGQADRCIEGRDRRNNIPCDAQRLESNEDIYTFFTGTLGIPSQTERAIWAMDICEFKDDDDDPSWGFARQLNMVFSLADGTRNSFDIGVIGPDERQVSVTKGFGKITPANGNYVLAISTGVAQDLAGPDFVAPAPGLQTTNDPVTPTEPWNSATARGQTAYDSIMGTFSIAQPSNMNAWSLQVAHLSAERSRSVDILNRGACADTDTFILVLQDDQDLVGTVIPADNNVARDEFGREFCTSNPSEDYFQYCNIYGNVNNQQQCRKSNYKLQNTGFEDLFGTPFRPVGGPATPRSIFEIKLATWDTLPDGSLDTTALFDDFMPIAEQRRSRLTGYMYTSDIELERITPDNSGIYPSNTASVILTFVIKNNGPERAEDITISFTPPKGMFFRDISAAWSPAFIQITPPPYQDNSFFKYRWNVVGPLDVGSSAAVGTITFGVRPNAPREMQVKLSATCSSVEKIWMNNYQVQMIYIDKEVANN